MDRRRGYVPAAISTHSHVVGSRSNPTPMLPTPAGQKASTVRPAFLMSCMRLGAEQLGRTPGQHEPARSRAVHHDRHPENGLEGLLHGLVAEAVLGEQGPRPAAE